MILKNFPRIIYTYSNEHQSYLWTPPKTGSNHANFIFNYFGFSSQVDRVSDGVRVVEHSHNYLAHSHQYRILPEHSDYKIICTARNPYKKLYSLYNNLSQLNQIYKYNLQSFKHFIMNQRDLDDPLYDHLQGVVDDVFNEVKGDRIPDYFLRIENLYEDYLKLPFVSGSSLNSTGILQEICQMKKHVRVTNLNLSDHIDQELQDFISTKYGFYFDLLGYSKDLP